MNTALNVIYYCKKCNSPMEMYGVTERGDYKYCCNNCHTRVLINPKYDLDEDIKELCYEKEEK